MGAWRESRDNYAIAVASGQCCWCGWGEAREEKKGDEKA